MEELLLSHLLVFQAKIGGILNIRVTIVSIQHQL